MEDRASTFSNQSKLPHLPIPDLDATLQHYRTSLIPLVEDLTLTDQALQEFRKHLGPILQERLQQHAASHPNWLEDWWYHFAYLTWRVPLMIHSNWWMNIRDDHLPAVQSMSRVPHGPGRFSFVQIRRAACILANLLDYKDLLDAGKIPPEVTKAGPLCMDQFRHLFGVTRIAEPNCDRLLRSFPCRATHVTVLIQDQTLTMDVYQNGTQRVPLPVLEATLTRMVQRVTSERKSPPIPILTATPRDTWAAVRAHLRHLGSAEALDKIESSLLVVSLDDLAAGPHEDLHHHLVAHGFGHNRWFDKSLNLIVTASGQAGCCGEHSPQDAMTPARLFEHALLREQSTLHQASQASPARPLAFTWWHWPRDDHVDRSLAQAELANQALIGDSDSGLLVYTEYGTDWIKQHGFSPDAFFQMVLQLAYHRLHGHVVSTYETASTRRYLHGRTETCRTCSTASKQFVESMHTSVDAQVKRDAFREALRTHQETLVRASQGNGVDRHLLGLKLVKRPDEPCALFDDPAFQTSSAWKLSTSSLAPTCYQVFRGTGFGCVHPQGYGINYFGGPHQLHFGIECKHSCPETSSERFRLSLVSALRDLKTLFEEGDQDVFLASKL